MKDFVKAITKREEDFAQWYTDVVLKAELASYSSVKGCMVIRPTGYALWEGIQQYIDRHLKATGHENVYMPLLIPEGKLKQEAEHVEGFAPELAWITETGEEKLVERLAIRPTSEVLFAEHFKEIIHSHRDLPKRYNQWANVVRLEKNTRPFLRTTEFLWQEGHTCHETHEEAQEEVMAILDLCTAVCEELLAIPVVKGRKTARERFAGARETYTLETLMYDGKALQIATSHDLGDVFSSAFGIEFTNREGIDTPVYQSSWGITTRTIGALIMVHGDDRGLMLPPRIAPIQVIIVPIAQHKEGVIAAGESILARLQEKGIRTKIDLSDKQPGWKFNESEMKGIPIRIEMGPRDMEAGQVIVVRRDTGEKTAVAMEGLEAYVTELLETIQRNLFEQAKSRNEANTLYTESAEEFTRKIKAGGFAVTPHCGEESCEEAIKTETTATARCMAFTDEEKDLTGKTCPHCGKPAVSLIHFARAY